MFNPKAVLMPIALQGSSVTMEVVSLKMRPQHFLEPFFLDSLKEGFNIGLDQSPTDLLVRKLVSPNEPSMLVQTPIREFVAQNKALSRRPGLRFIFHMSRCGSTLLAQMLATSRRFYVLSEPTLVNDILDPGRVFPEVCPRMDVLRAGLGAMIRCAPGQCELAFIKFRSWNVFYLREILAQFPETPWVYIHRDSAEVLASNLVSPAGWCKAKRVLGPLAQSYLDRDHSNIMETGSEESSARILEAFCNAAYQAGDGRCNYLAYDESSLRFIGFLMEKWGIELSQPERERMSNRAMYYSKDVAGAKKFIPDGIQKKSMWESYYPGKAGIEQVESARRKLMEKRGRGL